MAPSSRPDGDPGKFFDVQYPLPAERAQGKTKVPVRFQAHPDRMADGLFGLRVLCADQ